MIGWILSGWVIGTKLTPGFRYRENWWNLLSWSLFRAWLGRLESTAVASLLFEGAE